MVKRIISYLSTVLFVFLIVFYAHKYFLGIKELHYSLFNVYLFHVVSTVLIYVIVETVAWKLPSQAGYAYLASIFLKIGFFVMIFQATVFSEIELEKFERVSLIVPLFLFLIIEAVAVSKLLNSK
jgi:hypothetical protein